jgi:hypothetical protein
LKVIGWVAGELEGNGHVAGGVGDDQLVEMTVTDDEVPEPSAVDVSALCRQNEQGRVYQQLFVSVAVVTRGVQQTRPGPRVHLLTMSDRNIADIR